MDAYKVKHTEMWSGLNSVPALCICSSREKRDWTLSLFLGLHLLLSCTHSLWQEHLGTEGASQSSLEFEASKMCSHFENPGMGGTRNRARHKCGKGTETGRPGCHTESFWLWTGRSFPIKILSKTSMLRTTCYILNKVIQNTFNWLPDYFSACLIKHTK